MSGSIEEGEIHTMLTPIEIELEDCRNKYQELQEVIRRINARLDAIGGRFQRFTDEVDAVFRVYMAQQRTLKTIHCCLEEHRQELEVHERGLGAADRLRQVQSHVIDAHDRSIRDTNGEIVALQQAVQNLLDHQQQTAEQLMRLATIVEQPGGPDLRALAGEEPGGDRGGLAAG